LVDRKRALAGKVEGLYNGKVQQTFKEGKHSVKKWVLLKAARKLMGRVMNWVDGWEEEQGLVVRELGRRIVAEQWLMGVEALVNERKGTGRESTVVAWVSIDSIAPKLSQIQPFSLYHDEVKCNLDEYDKGASVHARYKCVSQKVKPVPLSDECTPDARLDWRGRAIARALPIPGPWDEWFISKCSHRARGGKITPQKLQESRIGSVISPK